jgi:exoribonuclease-2
MRKETELAVVVSPPEDGWFRAGTVDGKVRRFPVELAPLPPVGRIDPVEEPTAVAAALAAALRTLEARAAAHDLETLRECALLEDRALSIDELAELLFEDPPDLEDRGGLVYALLDEAGPFTREGTAFRPLDDAELAERDAQREAEAEARDERARRAAQTRERQKDEAAVVLPEIKRLLGNRVSADELSDDTREWLDSFRHNVIHDPTYLNGSGIACGGETLKIQDENHAVQLLFRGGNWEPDREDLRALRAGLGLPFPDDVVAEAESATIVDAPAEDLTALPTVTIDSPSTQDLDDAISITADGETFHIAIHIADVSRIIPIGGPLDDWGLDRSESIYLPERIHHLYPLDIMHRVSLDPGEERDAVTLRYTLNPAGEVVNPTFARTRIRSDERLDYDEVDRRISDGGPWQAWGNLVTKLQERRTGRGAEVPMLPDVQIKLHDGSVQVDVLATDTPSHRLVSELMILFNETTALYFREHGVPAIFKTQPAANTPPEYPPETDPLYFPRIIRLLRASIAGLDPAPHAFLGVEAYCQATSPIRRYADLIHQRQMVASLRGEPLPYDKEALLRIYPHLDSRGSEIRGLERRRRRYWVLKKLKSLRGQRLRGIVSQIRPGGRPVVFLPELLLDTPVMLPSYLDYEPGDAIYLSPRKVDPIRGGVWATPGGG